MIIIFRRTVALAVSLALLPVWPLQAADPAPSSSNDSAQTKQALDSMLQGPGASTNNATQGERASLDNMLVGPDQLQIHLSRPAKYNTFTTVNPPRIVLEILETAINVTPRVMAGQGANLKRVRAGQFQGEPDPICRVVLDLKQLVSYTVTPDNNMIVMKLGAVAAAPAAAASPETPAPLIIAAVPAPGVTVPSSNPEVVTSGSPAPVVPAATATPTSVAYAPAAAAPAAANNGEYSTKQMSKSAFGTEMNAIAAQNSVAAPKSAAVTPTVPIPYLPEMSSSMIAIKPSAHDIIGNLSKDTVSLDLQDTDIGDVLKLMAAKAGTNIIYGPDVSGTVSLHLSNVPFNEAFNVILGMKSLMVFQAGNNTLRVITTKQLQLERTNTVGVTQVFKIYYQDAADVKKELDAVRSSEKRSGQSVIDVKNNEIILTDSIDGLAAAERLISQLDVRPQQVVIETKLVEVNLQKQFDFGIQWGYFSIDPAKMLGQAGTNYIGGNPTIPSGNLVQPLSGNTGITIPGPVPIGAAGSGTGVALAAPTSFGAFSFGRITNDYLLNATLTAAASKGKAKVLSDPKIATLNGKQATINITTNIPYATTNTAATGAQSTTINNIVTGIQLTVTPTINADGRVTLHLAPNVTQPSATVATGGAATAGAIATDTRQADTNVVVRDGETIVIGGIITDSVQDTESSIPFFGDIPFLGWLFKNKQTSRNRVELLIFVTTKLLAD